MKTRKGPAIVAFDKPDKAELWAKHFRPQETYAIAPIESLGGEDYPLVDHWEDIDLLVDLGCKEAVMALSDPATFQSEQFVSRFR